MSCVAFTLLFYWEWDEVREWFLFVTRKDRSLLSLPMFIFGKRTESESVSQSAMSDSVAPWTAAHQAPPSMGFSRQEYWSGLPFPSPGGLPNPGIEPRPPALQADSLPFELSKKPWKRTD